VVAGVAGVARRVSDFEGDSDSEVLTLAETLSWMALDSETAGTFRFFSAAGGVPFALARGSDFRVRRRGFSGSERMRFP